MEEVEKKDAEATHSRRVKIGTFIISILGIAFGVVWIVLGSLVTWRSDPVLGIYSQSGIEYGNLVGGEGWITLALGSLGFIMLVLGFILRRKFTYGAAVICAVILFVHSIYELISLSTQSGVVGPGAGIYMIMGGSVTLFFCGMGGYLMVGEKESQPDRPA